MSYFETLNKKNAIIEISKFRKKTIEKKKTENKIPKIKPYPFSERGILSYLISNEFLSSINYDFKTKFIKKENEKIVLTQPINDLIIQEIADQIPAEKRTEEIEKEKRRRHQTYTILNYGLSQSSYFHFFSYESFKIAKRAKLIAQFYKQDTVTPELFILPFFDSKFPIGRLLRRYGLYQTVFKKILLNLKSLGAINKVDITEEDLLEPSKFNLMKQNNRFQNFWTNLKLNLKNFLIGYVKIEENEIKFRFSESVDQGISFSYEVHQIFEKSARNASKRFKTPIITPEILLLTIIEENNVFLSQEIKAELSNEVVWYLFRYKLLKYLHRQESNLKVQLSPDTLLFGYLLKTQIPGKRFAHLLQNKRLEKATFIFRNRLISQLVKMDLYKNFKSETNESIANSPNRRYSDSQNSQLDSKN